VADIHEAVRGEEATVPGINECSESCRSGDGLAQVARKAVASCDKPRVGAGSP